MDAIIRKIYNNKILSYEDFKMMTNKKKYFDYHAKFERYSKI